MSWDFIRDACAGTFDPKFQNQLTVANDWVVLAPDKLTIISGRQAGRKALRRRWRRIGSTDRLRLLMFNYTVARAANCSIHSQAMHNNQTWSRLGLIGNSINFLLSHHTTSSKWPLINIILRGYCEWHFPIKNCATAHNCRGYSMEGSFTMSGFLIIVGIMACLENNRETLWLGTSSLFDRNDFKSIGVSPKIKSIGVISPMQRSFE